jgi:hypothetical protein
MDLKYQIVKRKLDSCEQDLLRSIHLGEKVESPRRQSCCAADPCLGPQRRDPSDIPVTGSGDPKFSVFSIILGARQSDRQGRHLPLP